MIIKFSPQVNTTTTNEIIKVGNNLTINGELLDLGTIPNGATVPSEAFVDTDVVQSVEKDAVGGTTVEILWLYSDTSDWISSWPADLINPSDGPIAPIAATKVEPEPEPEPENGSTE